MALSSNSIIHFTNSKSALKGILESHFTVSYCKEKIHFDNNYVTPVIPMVSFCDIPLSEVKKHIKSYGNYGVGLTKEWAIKQKLNPVLYIDKNSILSSSLSHIIDSFLAGTNYENDLTKEQKAIVDIFRYMKNYQANLERNGRVEEENYRFSDEREWRFVPDHHKKIVPLYNLSDYEEKKIPKLLEGVSLTFEPNDIKYIIIDNDDEIKEFVRLLEDAQGDKYKYQDIKRLTTRIITSKQIIEDF